MFLESVSVLSNQHNRNEIAKQTHGTGLPIDPKINIYKIKMDSIGYSTLFFKPKIKCFFKIKASKIAPAIPVSNISAAT